PFAPMNLAYHESYPAADCALPSGTASSPYNLSGRLISHCGHRLRRPRGNMTARRFMKMSRHDQRLRKNTGKTTG
ncbi:hypothetical protein, partial [Cobetia sp. MC34]|uniref:hypothetical protein n=1 Tax=Cobetia sp. MC34 TaxID=2785080 RepID=UPI001BC96EF5